MPVVLTTVGLGLALAVGPTSSSWAATQRGHPATGTTATCRTIDFEQASVAPLADPGPAPGSGRQRLTVTGTASAGNVTVTLRPLVYITRPRYWGIVVTGCSSGIGAPVLTPYTATYDFSGPLGTCGIEVVGSDTRQTFDLAGCEKAPLTGTRWELDPASLGVPVPAGRAITAAFGATSMSGSTSCNAYGADYTTGPDSAFGIGPIRMTARACYPDSSLAESTFVTRLAAADRFSVTEKELLLLDAEGAAPLRFTAVAPVV